MSQSMDLSQASLADLVAELRKRLRHFVDDPARLAAPSPGGPLGTAQRAALCLRLLAAAARERPEPRYVSAGRELATLASAVTHLPDPLPDPESARALVALTDALEDLIRAWDDAGPQDVTNAWRRVREVADMLWLAGPAVDLDRPEARPATDPAPPAEPAPTTATTSPSRPDAVDSPPPVLREVWLLVAGEVRRTALRRRLEKAGARVVAPGDATELVARLQDARPDVVVCDDAAPTRHHRRLKALLPADAPPLVVVQSTRQGGMPRPRAWPPPYRPRDLLAALGS